jgi:hypothetical protein
MIFSPTGKASPRKDARPGFSNPWPRLALATGLMIWAGANLWSAIFRWSEIYNTETWNRGLGIFLTILVSVLPIVIGIFLIWTLVVGPDDPRFNRPADKSGGAQKKSKKGA